MEARSSSPEALRSQAWLADGTETVHSIPAMANPTPIRAAASSLDAAGLPPAPRPSTFEQLAAQPDECVDVALGAALIARDAHGSLDIDRCLARFDELAAPLLGGALSSLSLEQQADAISAHLFEQVGFRGNEQEYYDPRNSLLPDVLERRLGIPISLSIVYCEVARRVGVRACGVSFPGHFMVRVDAADSRVDARVEAPVMVDPFFGGRRIDPEGLQRLLERSAPSQKLDPEVHLAPASARSILVRMLINIKWVYATRGDFARALLALDRIISLQPDSVPAIRERGLLAARLGAVESARADLSRLLELVPQAPDATSIRARLEELRAKRTFLN
jgi:regulator of sirC expression with transglutaminase-like and TPR domain